MDGAEARVLGPGEGMVYRARGGEMTFKALAAGTGGAFSFMERTLPPGGRTPPPHVHEGAEEAFWVLGGTVAFRLGDEGRVIIRGAGTFVHVPGGVAHTFGNAGEAAARVLVVHAPALDGYFRDLHELWLREVPPTPDEERDVMRRHGMRPI